MTINLAERVKDTALKVCVIGGALYSIAFFDLGREAMRDVSYRAPPVLSDVARKTEHYFYDNTGVVTVGLIAGSAVNMLRKRKDKNE